MPSPKCLNRCGKRIGYKKSFFCSQKCAAEFGEKTAEQMAVNWCNTCRRWTDIEVDTETEDNLCMACKTKF